MSPFTFNSSQKKGILVLILLLLAIAVGRWGFQYFSKEKEQSYASPFVAENSQFSEIQPFDINRADAATWASLPGIGPVLSKRILSYRRAKKGFESVEDLKKVYGLKPEVYEQILPYLRADSIYKTKSPAFSEKKTYQRAPISPIDINLADSADFDQLPGIGPVLSARIIKYRDARKGFQSIEDIKSVYGIEPEVYQNLLPYLRMEKSSQPTHLQAPKTPAKPVAIDMNQADSAQWVQVPGIGKVMAPRIIKFRNLLGHFAEPEQLLLVYGMSEENYERARSFLQVKNLSEYPRSDINTAEWKHLVRFPFITKKLANDILAARKEKGKFTSWQEVAYVRGMKPEVARQLGFYFEIRGEK